MVVAATLPDDIVALSILRDGGILGGTLLKVRADNSSTADDIAKMLRELLAGRAAEELFFGHVSGGSGGSPDSDLARATTLAVSCEATWGLGKSLAWFGDMTPDECGRFISVRPDVASRVEARLAAAYAETLAMLSARRPAVETLAEVLLERQVLSDGGAGISGRDVGRGADCRKADQAGGRNAQSARTIDISVSAGVAQLIRHAQSTKLNPGHSSGGSTQL